MLLLAAVVCMPAYASAAHPFHTSMAEMEYNAKTRRFEVALKLYAVDCETALARVSGKPCDLDNEEARDKLLGKYIQQRFQIVDAKAAKSTRTPAKPASKQTQSASSTKRFNYVGSEVSGASLWVYFELEPPSGEPNFTLRNEVLLEVQPEQVNVIRLQHNRVQQTQFFNAKNKTRKLAFDSRPAKAAKQLSR
jgi:hypothetical protein